MTRFLRVPSSPGSLRSTAWPKSMSRTSPFLATATATRRRGGENGPTIWDVKQHHGRPTFKSSKIISRNDDQRLHFEKTHSSVYHRSTGMMTRKYISLQYIFVSVIRQYIQCRQSQDILQAKIRNLPHPLLINSVGKKIYVFNSALFFSCMWNIPFRYGSHTGKILLYMVLYSIIYIYII